MKSNFKNIVFILISPLLAVGQNLVPNASFENYKNLPKSQFMTFNEIGDYLEDWYCPSPSSPDYFHSNSTNVNSKVPNLLFINSNFSQSDSLYIFINPISGNAFVGLLNVFTSTYSTRHGIPTFYSEYIRVKTNKPLYKNHKYKGSFYYYNLASPSLRISDIGMLISQSENLIFSDSTFVTYNGKSNPPQVKSNGIINSVNEWVKLQNTFKSKGGEEYITIGLFRQENSLFTLDSTLAVYNSEGEGIFKNYFFIDSVSLFEVKGIIAQDTACFGENVTFYSNAQGPFWWGSDSYASKIYSTDSIFNFIADSSRWYYLFSSEGIDSVLLTVLQPLINLGNDTAICQGSSLILKVNSNTNNVLWQGLYHQTNFLVSEEGYYWAIAQENNCIVVDTVFVKINQLPNRLPLNHGQICSINKDWYTLNLSNDNSYIWSDGDSTNIKTFTNEGLFRVVIRNMLNCEVNDNISIIDKCLPVIYIPNAFSPDGVNKYFKPVTKYIEEIEWQIFNRNGEKIYYTKNINDYWDGTYNGVYCPPDVYFYILKYKGNSNEVIIKEGNITLIR